MKLSPEDLAQLDAAIRLAFQPRELERTLKFRLGRNLVDLSLASNFRDVMFDVLETAGREGWLESLIEALRAERPHNQGFCGVVDGLLADATVGRNLTPERLVRLAVVLGDLVEPDLVKTAFSSAGRSCEAFERHRSLQDFLITELMHARQDESADDLLRALAAQPLPEPASGLVASLIKGETENFDEALALEADRARALWQGYVTRPGILSRTSEFRRIIERRAADRAIGRLEHGLSDWERRICMVRYAASEPRESAVTGFLVGPDLVLFSAHLFYAYGGRDQGAPSAQLEFLFDHRTRSDGTALAEPRKIRAASPHPLAFSPSSQAAFALYRLEEPLGHDRGWANLEALPVVATGDPIILVHHADGGPLRMSIGSVEAVEPSVLTYDAPTAGGASGAPVLSDELEVLAIHSRKVPAPGGDFLKQGTPIPAILAELDRRGVSLPTPSAR